MGNEARGTYNWAHSHFGLVCGKMSQSPRVLSNPFRTERRDRVCENELSDHPRYPRLPSPRTHVSSDPSRPPSSVSLAARARRSCGSRARQKTPAREGACANVTQDCCKNKCHQHGRPLNRTKKKVNSTDTYLAVRVGPSASLAKLVGKSGLPGPRSPTTSYASLLAFDAA